MPIYILCTKNLYLAKNIIKNNWLLISEYYEEPKSQQELISRYQERDRLQALFSDYIILISSFMLKIIWVMIVDQD